MDNSELKKKIKLSFIKLCQLNSSIPNSHKRECVYLV